MEDKELNNTPEVKITEDGKEQAPKKSIWSRMWETFTVYVKHICYDIKRSIQENPCIIFGLLLMIPAILIGFMLSTHINASYNLTDGQKYSGLQMFILEMAGCLNVVWGFAIIKKRNIKSIIFAVITSAIIIVCGVLWIKGFVDVFGGGAFTDSRCSASVLCILFSLICTVLGTVGPFFFLNYKYDKEIV